MALQLTTELDAVNTMLSVIGESPVNSIHDTGLVDAVIAVQILHETMREVQTTGWSWNTDENYSLSPTFPYPGEIYLPANTLSVDPSDSSKDFVQRGLKLWDKAKQTFKFSEPVKVDITRLLEFDEIPQVARHYIMVKAARVFQDRVVGSTTLSGFNEKDELRAFVKLKNLEAEVADLTIYNQADTIRILGWPRITVFGKG
jgi:hypothetical protein